MIRTNLKLYVPQALRQTQRSLNTVSHGLKFGEYGKPEEVLKEYEEKVPNPTGKQVLVKILAAPINPADINTIQGKYPVKPKLPAYGGNECVGEIIANGAYVSQFCQGDHVVPFKSGLGTWRTYALFNEDELMFVPKTMGIVEAATLAVNPCTAYRMLKDFVPLQNNDFIIQNGANSAVGQAVFQLCKAWGLRSVGIVRDRPDIEHLKCQLKALGANEIFTEEEVRTTKYFEDNCYPLPRLGFNCVGGKNSIELTRKLGNGGVMVTYGGMSREPVTVPTASLIFKDITFRGFWMTRWSKLNGQSNARKEMFQELSTLIGEGQFVGPSFEMVPFKEYKYAMESALNYKGFTGKKFILNLEDV